MSLTPRNNIVVSNFIASQSESEEPLLTKTNHPGNKGTRPPTSVRYGICALLWLGLVVCYLVRVNISIACIPMAKEFNWTETQRGFVLSSFFYGYICTQIVGSVASDKYGGKNVFLFSIVWTVAFTVATPLVAGNFGLLLGCRALMGLGEALSYPAMTTLLGQWLPSEERAGLMSFVWSGGYCGTIFGLLFCPLIVDGWGWEWTFYLMAIIGTVWSLAFWSYGADRPEAHHRISQDETWYIRGNQNVSQMGSGHNTESTGSTGDCNSGDEDIEDVVSSPCSDKDRRININKEVPWEAILTSNAVWCVVYCNFVYCWSFYILVSWAPTYFNTVLEFDVNNSGFVSVLPFFLMAVVAVTSGYFADYVMREYHMPVLKVRQYCVYAGFTIPAMFLIVLALVPHPIAAVTFMTISLGTSTISLSGWSCNILDISPEYGGFILGIANTFASLPGICGVALTGYIVETSRRWDIVFYISAAIYVSGVLCYMKYGDVEKLKVRKKDRNTINVF
eukprot:GFYU01023060.1.p1 GENE.GFYU01023060.1~~GFYU01023060.1.p1  ORF type:complete len:506 (+),score=102.31 GFYU01023060.1:274-1791(+)